MSKLNSTATIQNSQRILEEENTTHCEDCTLPGQDKVSLLMHESLVLNNIISQIFKAIDFCLSRKEFSSSIETVEAEKHLLLASKFLFVYKM